jgi:hypothetical protein
MGITGECRYFKYLDSTVPNDSRCTRKIKSRIAMAKAAFNRKRKFSQQTALKLKAETSSATVGEWLCRVLNLDTSQTRLEIPEVF